MGQRSDTGHRPFIFLTTSGVPPSVMFIIFKNIVVYHVFFHLSHLNAIYQVVTSIEMCVIGYISACIFYAGVINYRMGSDLTKSD